MKKAYKKPLAFKTEKVVRRYDTFEMADRLTKTKTFPIELADNADIGDGNARMGVGVIVHELFDGKGVYYDWDLGAPKSFFYCGQELGLLTYQNKFYFFERSDKTYRLEHTFNGEMKFLEAQDKEGVFHPYFIGVDGIFSYDQTSGMKKIFELACLPVATVFQGRIFAAIDHSIVYCEPFSKAVFTESIDGGGKVVLPSDTGEVVDMVATSNAVYVFCAYGIWKLSAAGSARDFCLERVGFTGRKILKGSACAVGFSGGEKVLFFDEYGPWKLEHSGTMEICRNLTYPIRTDKKGCEHACLNGKVIYNYGALDGSVRNVVIDVETDQAYHSFTCEGLSDLKGQGVGVVDSFLYALVDGETLPIHKLSEIASPPCDFYLSGVKTLRQLKIFGEGQVTVSVSSEYGTRTFALQTQNGVASVDVRLKGELFCLRFVIGDHAVLRGLDVELCTLKGLR